MEDIDDDSMEHVGVGDTMAAPCEGELSAELNRDLSFRGVSYVLVRSTGLLRFVSHTGMHQETHANVANLCALQTREEDNDWSWALETLDGTLVEVVSGGSLSKTEVTKSITVHEAPESE